MKGKFAVVAAFVIVSLFLISAASGTARAYTPQPSAAPIEPNPMLEGNVTFANHTASQVPLEYLNQYGATANLSATIDGRTVNPYSVNANDIIAPQYLQGEKLDGYYWNSTANWNNYVGQPADGSVVSITSGTSNSQQYIQIGINTSASGTSSPQFSFDKYAAPSNSAQFDYTTWDIAASGPAGTEAQVGIRTADSLTYTIGYGANNGTEDNGTSNGNIANTQAGQSAYFTYPTSILTQSSGAFPEITLIIPKAASTAAYVRIYGFAATTYPMTLGTRIWNHTSVPATFAVGSANLTTFAPAFPYDYVASNGYTVAVTQAASALPAISVNTAQTPISSGSYVEQVTYSFLYGLPAAPSLTYGAFKFADEVTLAPAQYVSVTYAGTSYLSDYTAAHAQGNYTTLVSAASPTTNESWIGTVQYTQAQWNSISSPPGFFTLAGIAYYWYVAVGVIATALVGGSAWASRSASEERVIRGRK